MLQRNLIYTGITRAKRLLVATGVRCSFCAWRALERPGSRPECGSELAPANSVHEILRQNGIHPGLLGVYQDQSHHLCLSRCG